jgi:hypothetical protein
MGRPPGRRWTRILGAGLRGPGGSRTAAGGRRGPQAFKFGAPRRRGVCVEPGCLFLRSLSRALTGLLQRAPKGLPTRTPPRSPRSRKQFRQVIAGHVGDPHQGFPRSPMINGFYCMFYYCRTYSITKLFVWVGEESGGHVLREATSRGLCGLVCPSRTSERGG